MGSLNWASSLLILLIIPQAFWIRPSKSVYFLNYIIHLLCNELKAVLGFIINPGRVLFFTLSLSLPLWFGYTLQRFLIQFNYNMAHLVPEGTPAALIPLIVLIESI